jgi:hypothetical protein
MNAACRWKGRLNSRMADRPFGPAGHPQIRRNTHWQCPNTGFHTFSDHEVEPFDCPLPASEGPPLYHLYHE